MVSFEEFWDKLKKELMTGTKNNEDKRWYWIIPKWSIAEGVRGELSCRYDGGDTVHFKTANERWVGADRTEFETLYKEWDEYSKNKVERAWLSRDLHLRRTSYTIPTLKHFERLMR